MPNRLAAETSPYLLEHAHNPVDWYAWGDEAFARALAEQKPVFLSIGYSACHWCHVMERESFEQQEIARYLNEHYVAIKVDREERPDLDQVYMNAVQLMTGHGGWPMSVFLTPDKKPFYGGTYWPPEPRGGMPGFLQVLSAVAEAWQERRPQALEQADSLVQHLKTVSAPRGEENAPDETLLAAAARAMVKSFDPEHGGFGRAPKFPHAMDMRFLLRAWRRTRDKYLLQVVTHTLDKMAGGGIYDHLGGGFHRYSVDERWLVPHFEKMLYDNALLAPAYVEAYQVTGNTQYARVARETCDYVLREMTDPAGGFASTQDADSEGEEGKFFVWTVAEVETLLGPEAARAFCQVYDVSPTGNFEHANILNLPQTLAQNAALLDRELPALEAELDDSRQKLLAARQQRVAPNRDDKILVSWNGLMIEALVLAAGALDEPKYLAAAQRAADFVLTHMRQPSGKLFHTWRLGQAKFDAYLDDYAALAGALVSLYEADFNERWLDEAMVLAQALIERYQDTAGGGFFFTAPDQEAVIARQKDLYDNAVPSGNSLAAMVLLRLGKLTGRQDFLEAATGALRAAAPLMRQAPAGTAQMLMVLDMQLDHTPEIVVLGDSHQPPTSHALAQLRHHFLPNKVVACRPPSQADQGSPALAPLFAGKQLQGPEPAVFICRDFACEAPRYGDRAAIEAWRELAK